MFPFVTLVIYKKKIVETRSYKNVGIARVNT